MKPLSTMQHFLYVIAFLAVTGTLLLAAHQFSTEMHNIDQAAHTKTDALERLLTVSEKLMMDHVVASMRLLKDINGRQIGTPGIHGETSLGATTLGETARAGRRIPSLFLGSQPQTNNFMLVDSVTAVMGGTATLFVKTGDEFVRVSTNLLNDNGGRAIGTILAPHGKAIQQLRVGKPFYGVVDILGSPYVTGYEPMFNAHGEVVGAWYVGLRVDTQVIRDAVNQTNILNSGFAAVMDATKKIRFLSTHAPQKNISDVLTNHNHAWSLVSKKIPEWGFEIVIAYPLSEAYSYSITRSISMLFILAGVSVVLIMMVIFMLRRLIIQPLGGDPIKATELVRNISSGLLAEDGLQAPEGTLMGHLLKMRDNLREMVETLRLNAEKLSLSASVFEHAHDAICITDADTRVVEINPSFIEITGYSREEATGNTLYQLLVPQQDPGHIDHIFEIVENSGSWRGETWLSGITGVPFAAWLDIFAVRDRYQQVRRYVAVFSDITPMKEQQQKLERLAYHDALTQLPNRTLFTDRLQQALALIERTDGMLAVCYFDLDGFKPVNDTLGHEAGDQLLSQLAQRVRSNLRAGDTVARMGGDEFSLLLCNLQSVEECEEALDRLLEQISTPYDINHQSVQVSASIGVTLSPPDDASPDILLRHADQAMYLAKTSGKGRYHLFDREHDRQTRSQHEALATVKHALEQNELRLFYQPKVNMRLGDVIGMEALIRWQHPELGLRPPSDFLPIIENSSLSKEIGEWVIREALGQMRQWQKNGLTLAVSVNIAAYHLMQPDFIQRLTDILADFPDVPPSLLELEITESSALEDFTSIAALINECHAFGVTFSLDDFGTGYSSLTYLRRLPVDVLKIDQSFVRDMLDDPDDMSIVTGVISLSSEFKRIVIAEGVETIEHGTRLLSMKCERGQGYGIARPMPAANVFEWVRNYQPEPQWADSGA